MNNEIENVEFADVNLKKSEGITTLFDWIHSFIFAIVVIALVLTFCFRLVDVDGSSMNNTLLDNDKLFVSNLCYTPQTGDVVIISHGEHYKSPLVKRVIATEGQSLDIDFSTGTVTVDGIVIDEPYVSSEMQQRDNEIPSVIPEGKVFVMGDNRYVSLDSRSKEVGLIDEDAIIGKAYFVFFPFDRIKTVE